MRKWVKFINHESQSDIRKWVLRDYGNIFSLFLFLNTKDNITHLEKKGNLQNLRSIYHVILWHSSPWEDVEWWPFLTGWTLSFMVTILNLFSGWQGSRHPTIQNIHHHKEINVFPGPVVYFYWEQIEISYEILISRIKMESSFLRSLKRYCPLCHS